MAVLSQHDRNELVALYITMFNAAPTATKLAEMVAQRENGSTLVQVATTLSQDIGFASVFPGFLTRQEFADKLVAHLLGTQTPVSVIAWATNWTLGALQAAKSQAQIFVEAVQAVRATTDSNYTLAKEILANKVEVATYYASQPQSNDSLATRQQILSSVTNSAASVTDAKAAVDVLINPIQLDAAVSAQVHGLFKLLFDAAPGFTFLKQAQTIIKSGITTGDGIRHEGITGLADFLLTQTTTSSGAAINPTLLVDLIVTNLHASDYLVPTDLVFFKQMLNFYLSDANAESLLFVVKNLVSADISMLRPLQSYLADAIRVSETYSKTSTNTTTDLAVLQLKDEPLLTSGSITFTDTAADDTFTTQQGTLTVAPGFTGMVTYGIEGGTVAGTTATKSLTYGTVSINTTTGEYTFTPKDAAIEGAKAAVSESFKLTASDSATVPHSTLTKVNVNVTGANDLTTFSGSWLANVNAATSHINPVTGTLIAVDRDAGDTGFIAQSNVAVHRGTFSITDQGAWIYTPTVLVENEQIKVPVMTTGNVSQTIVITVIGQSVELVPI